MTKNTSTLQYELSVMKTEYQAHKVWGAPLEMHPYPKSDHGTHGANTAPFPATDSVVNDKEILLTGD